VSTLCLDLEADGFQEDVTIMHCLVAKELETGEVFKFYEDTASSFTELLTNADVLVGHNLIGYDFDILKMFYGWEPREGTVVVDTLVWSQVLNPDRQLPKRCPTSYKNPITNKLDRVTPHSLAAWGYRVGRGKPQHYDWTTFSPEMLHRCEEDVEITELVMNALLGEAGMSLEEYCK